MAETGTGIGVRLRTGREKMGLTQLQAAEKLHVDPKVVESLEAERFDALGAPVFVRGHLKHFAELIGEQSAELLGFYAATTQPLQPDLTRVPRASSDSKPSRLAVPALVVLIGFVLVGIVWWIAKSVSGPAGADVSRPKRGAQPVVIAPDITQDAAAAEAATNEVASGGAQNTANSVAVPSPIAAANSARSREASVPKATGAGVPGAASGPQTQSANTASRGSSAVGTTPSPIAAANNERSRAPAAPRATGAGVGAAGAPGTAVASATPTAARGKAMEVTLRFAADSWVEVYDASGAKLFYDVGSASSSHTVSGTPPFRVTVANAPGVTLDVNGKPATVPANAVKGAEAQFVINRSGRIVRATAKADGG